MGLPNNHPSNQKTNPFTEVPQIEDLDFLAGKLMAAKAIVKNAQSEVVRLEDVIARAVGTEDEGSFSVRCDHYKVTTTQPINRTVSKAGLEAIRREFPEELFEAMFDFKPSLNVKLFKECQHLRPEVYNLACKAVTSKPGKIAVKVEEIGGAA